MNIHHFQATLLFFSVNFSLILRSLSTEFIFNGFNHGDLLFYGNSSLQTRYLKITNESTFTTGTALYNSPVRTKIGSSVLPFSTSFIFSISPVPGFDPGHGLSFLFTPVTGTRGASSAQHLGLFNRTTNGNPENHIFAVELDVFENEEFSDVDSNHVGIDINSLTSVAAHSAGIWVSGKFVELDLNSGANYQIWIDYFGNTQNLSNGRLNISMARAGFKKPVNSLISVSLNLADIFKDEMFVGFCGATGAMVESHRILAWSFSNSNFSIGEALITLNLPNFEPAGKSIFRSTGFIAGISVAGVFVIGFFGFSVVMWVRKKKRKRRDEEQIEDWELEYWPHRIGYHEISTATKGFSESNLIGIGGNGKVYRGTLNGSEIAVKCIGEKTEEGMREFVAEISTMGRLKHRNLVGLRGWCKKDNGLILVYEFMENGSLDKRIFDVENGKEVMGWETRVRVLKDVCAGVLYLHEGWEARVLHRDIKASNVMLDGEMRGRLGDFGLARLCGHGQVGTTTMVVGTAGYMAPEIIRSGKATVKSDVFGFGVLVLEVVCGRRPAEEGREGLVEWVWGLLEKGELVEALDPGVREKGGWEVEEVERLLKLGLLCTYPDSKMRPSMRKVLRVLEGEGFEREENEGEGMEVYLLDKLKRVASQSPWYRYRASGSGGLHPTFEELRQSMSSSVSLSDSDNIVEGR